MARAKLRKSSGDRPAAAGCRVAVNPTDARSAFLKISAATSALSGVAMTGRMIRGTSAAETAGPSTGSARVRTVCTYCSVGCGIVAEVLNGVWLRQDIAADHPVSRGAHCSKGAGAMEMVTSPKRLKAPMKKVNGRWTVISWHQAIKEIGDQLLAIRKKDGPDALFFNGSAKVSTEMAYLQRKFAAFWGSNNIDNQARL